MSVNQQDTCICLLARVEAVDMKNAAKQTLYTVPTSKKALITMVVIRKLSAAVALQTYGFGGDATPSNWKSGVDLSTVDAEDDVFMVTNENARIEDPVLDAEEVFGLINTSPSGSAVTATVEVFGYEFVS